MRSPRAILTFAICSILLPGCVAQSAPSSGTSAETVKFTLDWPQAKPPRYSITVQSNGHASYVSEDQPSESTTDPGDSVSKVEFEMTSPNRDRIFALARQCNYFNGSFDYSRHKVAQTGQKTLEYSGPSQRSKTTYNWSENGAIEELTTLFQSISNTIEFGRRLQYLERFDKLGLNRELEAMQQLAAQHHLAEVQVVAPELRAIAHNAAYMKLAQERAADLLRLAPAETPSEAATERN